MKPRLDSSRPRQIGAHVSAAGGIPNAVDRIAAIGGNCLQLFITSPRGWRKTDIIESQVTSFKQKLSELDIRPVFIHALYLSNIATNQPELREKSIDALAHALRTADRIGAQGVIYHTGSKKDRNLPEAMKSITAAMREILTQAPGHSQLIIEDSAGQSGAVGSPFAEVGQMLRGADSPRVKVCLDTCHMFQAGYDIRTESSLEETLAEFEREVGLQHLVVMHANDAKKPLGSGLDRHENIGQGELGTATFKLLLHHAKLRDLPWIIEVPGFDDQGPDQKNLDILKELST